VPGNGHEIEVIDMFALLAGRRIDILKIDIEGGEIELFRSNVEWIEQTPLIVFELHDWQGGWRGAGHSVFSRLSTHPRDYMQRADNMFSFAHSSAQMN